MKSIWENAWFMIPALLFLNAGLVLTYNTSYGYEILSLNDWRREPLNSIFRFFTLLGEEYVYVISVLAALFWRYRYALMIALSGLITIPTVYLIKEFFAVDRPITFFRNRGMVDFLVNVPGVDLNVGQTSFPSGHTMSAFALYGVLTLIAGEKHRRLGLFFALLAIAVGVSRVFLVQHFLADVLAGAALGILVGWLVWKIDQTQFFQQAKWLDKNLLSK